MNFMYTRLQAPAFLILLLICLIGPSQDAEAFSISSGYGFACHEQITVRSAESVLDLIDLAKVKVPENKITHVLMDDVSSYIGLSDSDSGVAFIIASLVIGSRVPDTEGGSTGDRIGMAALHGDDADQHSHCLRKEKDDWGGGDEAALDRCKSYIRKMYDIARQMSLRHPQDQIISVPIFLEYYGKVNVQVNGTAYYLGVASHAIQDSFSHTIRTEDLRRVTHVMNFIDALQNHYDEEQDGLAHSITFDACSKEGKPLADAAEEATTEMILSLREYDDEKNPDPLGEVLDDWMGFEPGCNMKNDYCNSAWTEIARKEQTGPMIGCNSTSEFGLDVSFFPFAIFLGFFIRRIVIVNSR